MTDLATPVDRFAFFLRHFMEKLISLGENYPGGLLDHIQIALIRRRILPILYRLRAIADHVARGTLRRPPTPTTRTPDPTPRPPQLRWPHRLPGTHAWLIRIAQPLQPFGTYLATILGDPEMQALIAAAPQLRRLFRPLCRMLGTTTLADTAPPRPARPCRVGLTPPASPAPRPAHPAPIPRRAKNLPDRRGVSVSRLFRFQNKTR